MNLPKLGAINCHAGKLPFYRGRNVLNWALINDEREFGITVHHIDQGIDTGDIIMQQTFPITDDDTYSSLLNQAYVGCAVLLYDSIKALQSGTATRTPQRDLHPCGFYCVIRREGDERLNWNQPSRDVFNFIRAIGRPGPEARTFLCGAELRISRAVLIDEAPAYRGIPGSVLSVESDGLLVKTADSFIKVVEWSGPKRVRNGHRFQ
jgi:methionyl-tRNA formyltransferase